MYFQVLAIQACQHIPGPNNLQVYEEDLSDTTRYKSLLSSLKESVKNLTRNTLLLMAVEEGKKYYINSAEQSYLMKILNSLKDIAKVGELADCESAHKRAIQPTRPEQNPAKKSRPDQRVISIMHIKPPIEHPAGEVQNDEEQPSSSSDSGRSNIRNRAISPSKDSVPG